MAHDTVPLSVRSRAATGRRRILVIDDEAKMRRIIQVALEPAYQVRLAENGGDGMTQVRSWKPDLILLDFQMPGIDGLSVLTELKADPRTAHIPVVMVSGRAEDRALREGQAATVECLPKPFEMQQLREAIERHLRQVVAS